MTSGGSHLNHQDILALSREIQAIVGAGVPLDFGLTTSAAGLPDRLEVVSNNLATQIQAGRSLPDALESEASIPPVYKAVLVAGMRCGKSEEVLDDVNRFKSVFDRTEIIDSSRTYLSDHGRRIVPVLHCVGVSTLFEWSDANVRITQGSSSRLDADFTLRSRCCVREYASSALFY